MSKERQLLFKDKSQIVCIDANTMIGDDNDEWSEYSTNHDEFMKALKSKAERFYEYITTNGVSELTNGKASEHANRIKELFQTANYIGWIELDYSNKLPRIHTNNW